MQLRQPQAFERARVDRPVGDHQASNRRAVEAAQRRGANQLALQLELFERGKRAAAQPVDGAVLQRQPPQALCERRGGERLRDRLADVADHPKLPHRGDALRAQPGDDAVFVVGAGLFVCGDGR